jgi:hypothetical protein
MHDIKQFVQKIQQLNPNAIAKLIDKKIVITTPSKDSLRLPEGFYYNDKNKLTDKHNTLDGTYVSYDIEHTTFKEDDKKELENPTDIHSFARALKELNPGLIFEIDELDNLWLPYQPQNLPEGFYYNDKNGFSNKHNTSDGNYINFNVQNMSNEEYWERISQSTDIKEVAQAIQFLNLDSKIELGIPGVTKDTHNTFASSTPAEMLNLPPGFYYDKENGITNKNNTQTGLYGSFKTELIEKEINNFTK